ESLFSSVHGGLTTIIAAPLSRFGSFNGPTRISARSALAALSRRTLWQGHPGAAFNRIPNCVDGGRLFAGCCCQAAGQARETAFGRGRWIHQHLPPPSLAAHRHSGQWALIRTSPRNLIRVLCDTRSNGGAHYPPRIAGIRALSRRQACRRTSVQS